MKVEVNEKDSIKDIKYPCIMVSRSSGRIVLFTSEDCGVDFKAGVYGTSWDMEKFTPFNGTITLQND